MKTAKKALLLTVCALVLVVATVMGTMAYLTDAKTVTNTFTVGDVKIKLDEAPVDAEGKKTDGERTTANKYKMLPGSVLDKDPTVTVLGKSEDSYVRVLVTLTHKAEMDAIFADVPGHANMVEIFSGMGDKWTVVGEVDNHDNTHTYELRYNEIVPRSESDTVLQPVFTQVNVPGFIDNDQLATVKDFQVIVVAQAIQAYGFKDADAAWAEFK